MVYFLRFASAHIISPRFIYVFVVRTFQMPLTMFLCAFARHLNKIQPEIHIHIFLRMNISSINFQIIILIGNIWSSRKRIYSSYKCQLKRSICLCKKLAQRVKKRERMPNKVSRKETICSHFGIRFLYIGKKCQKTNTSAKSRKIVHLVAWVKWLWKNTVFTL